MNIKTGDIVQFRYNYKEWYWKLLFFFVDMVDGRVHHTALYYKGNMVLEAMQGKGIRYRQIDIDKGEMVKVLRVPNVEITESDIISYYKRTKTSPYSIQDWIVIATRKLLKKFGISVFKDVNDKDGYICSEFVRDFFLEKGRNITPQISLIGLVSPNDIDNNENLEVVKEWGEW